jgi:hypothetical protein
MLRYFTLPWRGTVGAYLTTRAFFSLPVAGSEASKLALEVGER